MEDGDVSGQGSPAAGASLRVPSAPGLHAPVGTGVRAPTSLGLRGAATGGLRGAAAVDLRGAAGGGLRAPGAGGLPARAPTCVLPRHPAADPVAAAAAMPSRPPAPRKKPATKNKTTMTRKKTAATTQRMSAPKKKAAAQVSIADAHDDDGHEWTASPLQTPGSSDATDAFVDASVPAHVKFQAALDREHPDYNVLDEMSQSGEGYVGMMHDAIGLDDFSIGDDPFEPAIEEDDVVEGGNYSVAEDEALVLAWQEVTQDPVVGKDQPGGTYWQRISDHFHNSMKSTSYRTIGSLNHRWSSISECVTRWSGCVENVERQQVSGSTMQMRQNTTQELYKERDPNGRQFGMLHCWTMLQHNEKWINRNIDPHPLKKRAASDMESEDYEDDDGNESGRSTTPIRGQWGGEGGDVDVIQSAFQDMITSKKEIEASRQEQKQAKIDTDRERWEYMKSLEEHKVAIEQERLKVEKDKASAKVAMQKEKLRVQTEETNANMAIERDKLRVQAEEASAKKLEQECKIMLMPLGDLDDQQRAWVLSMRADIARKATATTQSENDNES
ncbi:hypothetical protein EJB05_00710, partial [Eragrostis curvula]